MLSYGVSPYLTFNNALSGRTYPELSLHSTILAVTFEEFALLPLDVELQFIFDFKCVVPLVVDKLKLPLAIYDSLHFNDRFPFALGMKSKYPLMELPIVNLFFISASVI